MKELTTYRIVYSNEKYDFIEYFEFDRSIKLEKAIGRLWETLEDVFPGEVKRADVAAAFGKAVVKYRGVVETSCGVLKVLRKDGLYLF